MPSEPTIQTRRTNILALHSGKYLNTPTVTKQHVTDNVNHLPIELYVYIFNTQETPPDITSSNTDPNNNTSHDSRGRRGGRAYLGRSRGRGFIFNLDAEMVLMQHLIRRGHSQRLPCTDNVSRNIETFHESRLTMGDSLIIVFK